MSTYVAAQWFGLAVGVGFFGYLLYVKFIKDKK